MMKRITLKGGPLDGKTYDVPAAEQHIAAKGGTYRLTKTTGKWEAAEAKPGARATVELDKAPSDQSTAEAAASIEAAPGSATNTQPEA